MAIRKVARLGHPVLRRVATPVDPAHIGSPELERLVRDLLDTVDDYSGAGLAAPQIHDSRRVVVLEVDEEHGMEVWFNPVLTPLSDDHLQSFEGCLSVPGLRGLVSRPAAVRVEAFDRTGQPFVRVLEGFSAVVAQHECDHLDGIVYVDKVEPQSLTFTEEHRRFGALLWGPSSPSDDTEPGDETETDDEATDLACPDDEETLVDVAVDLSTVDSEA